MNFQLSPEMENEIIRRVRSEQEKMGGQSETERQKLVGRVAREVITESVKSNVRNTTGLAAAISPEAKDMAIRELKAGTPLKDVQDKLLDLAGVTPEAGKATQGQDQRLSFKNVTDDEFLNAFSNGMRINFTDETPANSQRSSGRKGQPIRMSEISDEDFARALSNPTTYL